MSWHMQVSLHLASHAGGGGGGHEEASRRLDVGLAGMFEPAREDDLDAVRRQNGACSDMCDL